MASTPTFYSAARILRSLSELAPLSRFIHHVAKAQHFDEEVEYELQLVAEELFTNMVKYSPEGEPEIQVRVSGDVTRVKLVLEERGVRPFDPTHIPARDIDKPASERRPGGLGVHLVRTLMDEFHYRFQDGVGTTTVTRKLGARHA